MDHPDRSPRTAGSRRLASRPAISTLAIVALGLLTGWTFGRSPILDEAERAARRGDTATSVRLALDHLDRRPGSVAARRLAGVGLIRLDRPDLAEPYVDLGPNLDRDDAVDLAQAFERAGQIDRAVRVYVRMAEVCRDDAETLAALTRTMGTVGRDRESLGVAERLVSVTVRSARSLASRGSALLRLGRAAEADDDFAAVLASGVDLGELGPGFGPERFWAEAVDASLESGRVDAIRRALEASLATSPDDPIVLTHLAAVVERGGKAEEANRLWTRANEVDPMRAMPWVALGRIALAGNRVEDAIRAFRRAVAFAPDDPVAHYNLSLALRRGGHAREADRALRKSEAIRRDKPGRPRGMDAVPGSG